MSIVPQILRARGYRLYTKDGRRLVDLWLNGGAALLGHNPPNILREIKNTASRGLYAPFPHFAEGRLLKALSLLLPEYKFRIYNSAFPVPQCLCAMVWRPFTNAEHSLLRLIIPTPLSLCVIATKDETDLPPGETLPPLTLTVAARAVHNLIAASTQRSNPHLPRTFKTLKESACPWRREGIYLYRKDEINSEQWEALHNNFLKAGFLLPPSQDLPIILPGEMSPGEDAKLAELLR